MMILHPARNEVAPLLEKTAPASPAVVFSFAGNEGAIIVNIKQAQIIDRLRNAAREHGEVADLLSALAECFQSGVGDAFTVSDESCAYLATAAVAASFVALDRQPKDKE